ncbi:MAG: hypothetical protein KG003_09965 [Bacteroidetes bacterium]|nr:hypothetical protein [Bacteroidota bacterium]
MTLKNVNERFKTILLKKLFLIAFLLLIFQNTNQAQFIGKDSVRFSICEQYEEFRSWLPDAYIFNAGCACNYLPSDSAAMAIRAFLINAIISTSPELRSKAWDMKEQYLSGRISRRKYKKFVRKNIAPKIYLDHVLAYRFAGCKKGPAPFWEFRYSCIHPFRHCKRMLQLNLMFGGSCKKNKNSW